MESALRRSAPGDLKLIETLRREADGGFPRLPRHLARLARGAAALAVPFDRGAVERALGEVAGDCALRVRLTLALDGALAVEASPLPPDKETWRVRIASERLNSDDPWLGVKTTERRLYDCVRSALPDDIDEAIFLNERGQVCDGTITTVFADLGDGLLTPPLDSGPLPGVLRAEMLARGACREAVLRAADVRVGRLFVGNALRGLSAARLA